MLWQFNRWVFVNLIVGGIGLGIGVWKIVLLERAGQTTWAHVLGLVLTVYATFVVDVVRRAGRGRVTGGTRFVRHIRTVFRHEIHPGYNSVCFKLTRWEGLKGTIDVPLFPMGCKTEDRIFETIEKMAGEHGSGSYIVTLVRVIGDEDRVGCVATKGRLGVVVPWDEG